MFALALFHPSLAGYCTGIDICCVATRPDNTWLHFSSPGRQDKTDYLRAHHSLWHAFVGFASFYLWQTLPKRDLDRDL